jgi:uncharacterized protein (TIGR02266 family)
MALASIEGPAQRGGRRRPARLPVRLASPGAAWRGRVKDISRSGLFVALPHPPPLAAAVEVSLRLPGAAGAALQARGVVVRQVAPDPDSHLLPGVGVRFTDLDALTEARIASFVGDDDPDEGIGDDAG